METISLRLSDRDKRIIQEYAKINSMSVSELIRRIVIAKIEDDTDVRIFDEIYRSNQKMFSLKEIEKELTR
ncbi:MAG: hypothetical protein KMY54_04270 [Erysipelothrix sp.]|jgi:hypothetical protein|nr:hypothetical protein [Erysipelothrix sp.]